MIPKILQYKIYLSMSPFSFRVMTSMRYKILEKCQKKSNLFSQFIYSQNGNQYEFILEL